MSSRNDIFLLNKLDTQFSAPVSSISVYNTYFLVSLGDINLFLRNVYIENIFAPSLPGYNSKTLSDGPDKRLGRFFGKIIKLMLQGYKFSEVKGKRWELETRFLKFSKKN